MIPRKVFQTTCILLAEKNMASNFSMCWWIWTNLWSQRWNSVAGRMHEEQYIYWTCVSFSTCFFVSGGLFVWIWTVGFCLCAYILRDVLTFLRACLVSDAKYAAHSASLIGHTRWTNFPLTQQNCHHVGVSLTITVWKWSKMNILIQIWIVSID